MQQRDRRAMSWGLAAGLTLVLMGTAACGGAEEPAEPPAAAMAPAEVIEPEAGTIARAPTADNALPPAILGTAPPPRGIDLPYMPDDAETRGYLAVPEGPGPHPAVLLVHEWDGLTDRIRQTADAFAAEGYVALAADLYRGRTGSNRDENMALVQETRGEMDRVVANLDMAARTLRERADTTGKVAVMGWCFGGGIALSYGIDGEAHEATAMFYGQLVEDPEQLRRISHELYGTFAANDTGIPPADVEQFARALTAAGIDNDIHVYDEVGHGFWLFVDQDRETREAPALDAWQRLKAYLSRTIGA